MLSDFSFLAKTLIAFFHRNVRFNPLISIRVDSKKNVAVIMLLNTELAGNFSFYLALFFEGGGLKPQTDLLLHSFEEVAEGYVANEVTTVDLL